MLKKLATGGNGLTGYYFFANRRCDGCSRETLSPPRFTKRYDLRLWDSGSVSTPSTFLRLPDSDRFRVRHKLRAGLTLLTRNDGRPRNCRTSDGRSFRRSQAE